MIIQPYQPHYRDEMAELWRDSFLSSQPDHFDDATVLELAEKIDTERANGWTVYVAIEGETLLGFTAFVRETAYLAELFIAPAAQNNGVGSALLDFVKQQMPDRIWLRTLSENTNAHRFYLRHGFRPVEQRPHSSGIGTVEVFEWP